jgi:hypothetical protein
MPGDNKSTISQEGRDLALIFALTNTAVNQAVLQEIYMKTFGISPEETEAHLADLRKQTFADVCATLAKYGNLDVSSLLQSLGLSGHESPSTNPKQS